MTTLAEISGLLRRLIDFVASPPSGQAFRLTLQDMALCQYWFETQSRRGLIGSEGPALDQAVRRWVAKPDIQDLNTAGRRHQLLLRELIDLLLAHRTDTMTVEEAGFLSMVLVLAREIGEHPVTQRVVSLLAPHSASLETRKSTRDATPGLVALERRIQYATEVDIRGAEASLIRLLAGVELPCRGPIFKASGNLRLLGDVPDGCTVVVENDGCCSIDGYVMGRVLSKRHCEVRHNISGVVIVLTGQIRARGIINNAIAISKMGSVRCINAQGPRLIFGGLAIEVDENVLMGRLVTRNLHVGGEVRGSRLEVSGEATATHFRHLGMSTVSVVLRRELSCADFGEVTGAELNQLLSRAYGLRRHARNFAHLAVAARREADHSAQSILMFIFGGGEVQKRLESLLRAQRRHGFVTSVVENLCNMLMDAREGIYRSGEPENQELPETLEPEYDGDDEELKAVQNEAKVLRQSLQAQTLDRRQTTLLLQEVREKLARMRALQAQMAEQVLQEERAVQNIEKYEQILAGGGKGATKLEVLQRILPALNKQPPESSIGKRIRAGFTVRALRTVDRAVRHAEIFDQKASEHLNSFRGVSERLGKDYQVRLLENPDGDGNVAWVTGRFEGGVRVYMDEYVENLADALPDSIIITPNEDVLRTYRRQGAGERFYTME